MIHMIRLAWRHVTKRKLFSVINIVGLSLGLSAAALMLLYARYEWNFDRFHNGVDRIHLVQKYRFTALGLKILDDTWIPLLPALKAEYPAIESGARVFSTERWVEFDGRKVTEPVTYADASIFDVFSLPLAKGDARTALNDLSSVVLSKTAAEKYFGNADPIGKRVRINFKKEYTVTGVLQPIPANASLRFDFLLPFGDLINLSDPKEANNWGGSFLWTYLKLKENESTSEFETLLQGFVKKQFGDDGPNGSKQMQLRLLGLTEYRNSQTGNRLYIYALSGIAATILLIAGFNYTNLSAVRLIERVREIGVRKACGALRGNIIRQLVGETLMVAGLASVAGVILTDLFLPVINRLYAAEMVLLPVHVAALLGAGLLIGVIAVVYPALTLSRAAVIGSLKGQWSRRMKGVRLQDVLVVLQFAIAIVLIVGTLGIQKQLDYMQSQKLNFDQDRLISIPLSARDFADREKAGQTVAAFRQKLSQRPEITSVTASYEIPGRIVDANVFATPEGWTAPDPLRMRRTFVDDLFFQTLGIPLIVGRNFDRDRSTEQEESIILNESAAKAMGWGNEAIGKRVRVVGQNWTVIGIVSDYHTESLKSEIRPMILFYRGQESPVYRYLTARLAPGRASDALEAIRSMWQDVDPSRAFEYVFLDDAFRQLYESEIRWGRITALSSGLAVFIACIGLLGLVAISVVQRTKEIGIRKVLGASSGHIVTVLARRYAALVILSNVIAWPLAYIALDRWLRDFAYRTTAGTDIFLISGTMALGVALATIGVHTWRAANRNPVEALRYE